MGAAILAIERNGGLIRITTAARCLRHVHPAVGAADGEWSTPRMSPAAPIALPPPTVRCRQEPLLSPRRTRIAQPDVQFAQLLLVHRARRVRQQVLRALGLRE